MEGLNTLVVGLEMLNAEGFAFKFWSIFLGGWLRPNSKKRLWVAHPCGFVFCKVGFFSCPLSDGGGRRGIDGKFPFL
jgi:hypothetical protein